MTDTPISAERVANMYEERARFAEHEIAAIYREFVRKLRALSPPGLREALDEIAATYEAQLATHALGGDTPYGEGYNDGALDATKGFVKALRSRLSALPESGGAATKPIASDDEHAVALARVEELMDARAGTPDGDELSALVDRVEAYEDKRWPIDAPSPDALAPTDEDALAIGMMAILHEHLSEVERPASWSDFSDDQAARIRKAVRFVRGDPGVDALAQERAGVWEEAALLVEARFGGSSFLQEIAAALRTRAKEKTDE